MPHQFIFQFRTISEHSDLVSIIQIWRTWQKLIKTQIKLHENGNIQVIGAAYNWNDDHFICSRNVWSPQTVIEMKFMMHDTMRIIWRHAPRVHDHQNFLAHKQLQTRDTGPDYICRGDINHGSAGSRELGASDTFKHRWQRRDGAGPEWSRPATSVSSRKNSNFRETFLASLDAFLCHFYLSYTYNPW